MQERSRLGPPIDHNSNDSVILIKYNRNTNSRSWLYLMCIKLEMIELDECRLTFKSVSIKWVESIEAYGNPIEACDIKCYMNTWFNIYIWTNQWIQSNLCKLTYNWMEFNDKPVQQCKHMQTNAKTSGNEAWILRSHVNSGTKQLQPHLNSGAEQSHAVNT